MEGTATAAAVPGKGPNPDYKEVSGLAKKRIFVYPVYIRMLYCTAYQIQVAFYS